MAVMVNGVVSTIVSARSNLKRSGVLRCVSVSVDGVRKAERASGQMARQATYDGQARLR